MGRHTAARPSSPARSRRASASGSGEASASPRLFSARPADIWAYVKTQPLSFWGICFYLFIEYVRPQQVWPSLDVLPWGQTALAITLLGLILEGPVIRLGTVIGPLLGLFTLIVFSSALGAYSPEASFERIWEFYVSWVLVYLLIVTTVTDERRFFTFMLLFLLCSFKMAQHGARTWASVGFGFQSWGATGGPGWFHNSGEFGIQMCVFFPLAIAFYIALRDRWGKWTRLFFLSLPVTAIMSIIASSSRGALLGVGLVLASMVARSRHRARAALAAVVVALAVWLVIPPAQKTRLYAMGDDETSQHRLTMWEDGIQIARDHPVLGIGFANWRIYYQTYGRDTHGLPHNIFVQAGAELGYSGFVVFLALIAATFFVNHRTRRIAEALPGDNRFLYQMGHGLDGALIGFIGSGFFVTVLYYPYFWINLALTAALHTAARNKAARVDRHALRAGRHTARSSRARGTRRAMAAG